LEYVRKLMSVDELFERYKCWLNIS
jgi:hypothetical protein